MSEHINREVRLQRAVDSVVAVIMEMREDATETDNVTLGDLIYRNREAWGLSLQALADRCGFSKAYAWELEQGRSINPSVSTLSALAEALRIAPETLFTAALTTRRLNPALPGRSSNQ